MLAEILVDTWVRERLSSPVWRTPFIFQYPNAYPLVLRLGVTLCFVSSPLNCLGIGYKARGVGQLLHLVEHSEGRERKEHTPKNRPAYLADSYLGISLNFTLFPRFCPGN